MSKTMIKSWIKLLGVCCLLANSITFYTTFLTAYFSDSKQITVSINDFGEANFELLLAVITLLMGTIAVSLIIMDVISVHDRVRPSETKTKQS